MQGFGWRGCGVEESPIPGIAIHPIIKTGPGPIYRHRTRGTIKQYIVNVKMRVVWPKARSSFGSRFRAPTVRGRDEPQEKVLQEPKKVAMGGNIKWLSKKQSK